MGDVELPQAQSLGENRRVETSRCLLPGGLIAGKLRSLR